MRILLLIVALLMVAVPVGCGKDSTPGVDPLTDGGFDRDGGIDGGRDGGIDGGRDGGPDGGIDGGLACDDNNIVEQVLLETRIHIPLGESPHYEANPPVSGQHWGEAWARWQIHSREVPRGYWVHNLEHGGVVFLYHPDTGTQLVQKLTNVYNAIPLFSPDPETYCGPENRAVVLTPDHLLDVPWAVTVSGPEYPDGGEFLGVGYRIKGRCIRNEQDLVDFAVQHRNKADNGEDPCVEGDYVP
jgi:hypothetical protein